MHLAKNWPKGTAARRAEKLPFDNALLFLRTHRPRDFLASQITKTSSPFAMSKVQRAGRRREKRLFFPRGAYVCFKKINDRIRGEGKSDGSRYNYNNNDESGVKWR